jgi:hypothetical protein
MLVVAGEAGVDGRNGVEDGHRLASSFIVKLTAKDRVQSTYSSPGGRNRKAHAGSSSRGNV